MSTTKTEDRPAAQGILVTGPTLGHVIRMTAAGSLGLVAVFAVDALNLFYITLLERDELTAALGYATTVLFVATSMAIGLSIAATALTSRALGAGRSGAVQRPGRKPICRPGCAGCRRAG